MFGVAGWGGDADAVCGEGDVGSPAVSAGVYGAQADAVRGFQVAVAVDMREVLRVAGTGPGKSDVIPEIDWGAFDRYPKQEIECRDGTIYESHAKLAVVEGRLTLVTQDIVVHSSELERESGSPGDRSDERR